MHFDRGRLEAVVLLLGAVGFAVLGQFYLTQRREYVWDGIIFVGVALICFIRLMGLAGRAVVGERFSRPPGWRERGRRLFDRRKSVMLGLALLTNLFAARSANTQPPPNDYTLSVLLWFASLVLLYATFVPLPLLLRNASRPVLLRDKHDITRYIQQTIRNNRRLVSELAIVLSLIFIGLVLRVWDLAHIPANLSGDEGTQGMWAVDALRGRLRNPFTTGWFTVPTMSFFAQAASLRLFGDSVAGLRALPALIGTATLVFTYLLARRNLNRRVALFALATLTFNHYHIHFSRLASNQIADALFIVLTLWLLTEGLRRSDGKTRNASSWFLTTGLILGLSWYGYFGSRVILLIVAVYLGVRSIAEQSFLRRTARPLTLMALMAIMVASPLLLYYTGFPENLSARFNQVNFFRWLENELARPDHESTFNLVVRQVWRSISAFNHTLDPTFWYLAQIPLLDFISGILFILGVAAAIAGWRRPAVRMILIWFVLAIIFGWVLTENPPSSMRMVIAAPAVALLVALGLDRVLILARWAVGGRHARWQSVASAIVALAALLNVYYYFGVYTPTRVYGNPTAETATVLARYLRDPSTAKPYVRASQLASGWEKIPYVYFYGPPFLYYDFGTIQFIARDVPGMSVPPRDQDPGFRAQVTGPTLFVVLRERLDELAAIQAQYPNGRLLEFYSTADKRLMFVVYEVLQ